MKFPPLLLLLLLSLPLLASSITGQSDDGDTTVLGQLEYLRHMEAMSLDEVRRFEPDVWQAIPRDEANFGFDQQHYWFRVPVQPNDDLGNTWFLRCIYPLLDVIDVYLFEGQRLRQEFHAGDKLEFAQRPVENPGFVFPLNFKSNEQHWLYIHVYTSSSMQLPISLQPEASFWQIIAGEHAFAAAFYSILICMLVYNAVIFLMVRERSYLYYVLYLGAFTVMMASIHGWAYPILWPTSPVLHEKSVVISLAATIWAAMLFGGHFLRLREVRPEFNRIITMIAVIAAACGIASLFVPYGLAIRSITLLGLIATLVGFALTIAEWLRSRSREVAMFFAAWGMLMVGFVLYIGQKFGWLPVNAFTEHAIELGAILEVLLLALGLAEKINTERQQRLNTQQQLLDMQIRANEELDQKVRERTEELELLNGQLQLASVTDPLTQVKNRRYFDKKLPSEYRRSFREKSWVSLLMMDIDHFKNFNDEHGHQAGDQVLQEVAKAVEDVVKRPSDAVSRYGGEEFAILLPNTNLQGAALVAERIREQIESLEIRWHGKVLKVTTSIGLAGCIPAHRDEFELLTKQADNYLYVAKEQGRNCVIFADNDPSESTHG